MEKVSHIIEHNGLSIKVVIGNDKGIYKALSYVVYKGHTAINHLLSDKMVDYIETILYDYCTDKNKLTH